MPNHLAASTSPSMRQHADDPLDWREWGVVFVHRLCITMCEVRRPAQPASGSVWQR